MTDLNRDTGGTSQRRGAYGDPWRREARPRAETPLGQLIAGRIDQTEYRRRMAHLERRDAELLDVEPDPARAIRDAETRDEFRSGRGFVWLGLAWLVGFVLIALLVATIVKDLAAPRSAAPPHDPAARGDMAGIVRVSPPPGARPDAPLIGAPLIPGGGAP